MALSKVKSKVFKTKYFGFVIGAVIFLLFLWLSSNFPLLDVIEQNFIDFNFRLKLGSVSSQLAVGASAVNLNPKVSSDIIMIGIDNEALDKLGKWPFPRAYEATLLNAFTRIKEPANRENSIFLDINFVEADEKAPENDVLLIDSIRNNGRVYLESFFHETDFQQSLLDMQILRQKILFNKTEQLKISQIKGDFKKMHVWKSVEAPLKPYGAATYGYGDVSSLPDDDKIFRRQFLLTRFPELLEEIRLDNLLAISPVNADNFERLSWMDRYGQYHHIPYPVNAAAYAQLKIDMEKDAPQKEVLIPDSGDKTEKYYVVYKFKDYMVPSVTLNLALGYLNVKLMDIEFVLGEYIRIPNPQKFNVETQTWEKYLSEPAGYNFPNSIPADEFEGKILANIPMDQDREYLQSCFEKDEKASVYKLKEDNKGEESILEISRIMLSANYAGVKQIHGPVYLDEIKIPIDDRCRMIINYMGGSSSTSQDANQTYTTRPFYGYYAKDPGPDQEKWPPTKGVPNKILIVGMFAKGLADEKPTPFGLMFGPEIIANALNTIIMNNFLIKVPAWVDILILLGLILIATLIASRLPILWSMFLSLAIIVVYFFVNTLVFDNMNHILNFTIPAVAIIFDFISIVVFRVMTEERDKQKIKNMFGKYVPSAIVEKMLDNPPELGGVDKELTVLFSDIRGFTTLSERLTPQALVNHLNEYLTAMTDTIFDYNGTLDKYVGDEIMCFWGAPLPQADHAILACKCALKQMEMLHQLNENWPPEKRLDIGIGLNSGIMTVGNMGSQGRMNYTLMGDMVNLGARLEGTNKEYATNVIISEFTYGLVKNKVIVRELDNIRVKGKNKPVLIYELIDIVEGV